MNARLLGTLCIVGSLFGVAESVRQIILGTQVESGLRTLDAISSSADLLAAIGGLCGVLGLMALRATGSKTIFRILGYLPAVSYIAVIISSLGLLAHVLSNNSEDPVVIALVLLGDIFGPLAWLVVGIITIAAKKWMGWRRFVPLGMMFALPLGIVVSSVTNLVGTFTLIAYGVAVLLGYAVQSSATAAAAPDAMAQRAYS